MFKSSVILFCFNLNLQLFDLLMVEPETPHFYDSGTFEQAFSSQNQLLYLWRHHATSKDQGNQTH